MLPIHLDQTDVDILKSLMEDGRKSFRAISREIQVSSPTVKARYDHLVNMGLIKAIRPEIDFSRIDKKSKNEFGSALELPRRQMINLHIESLHLKMKCEFCGGPIHDKPKVLKFAKFERFFCCTQCRASYKGKHAGRIEMIKEQYQKAR